MTSKIVITVEGGNPKVQVYQSGEASTQQADKPPDLPTAQVEIDYALQEIDVIAVDPNDSPILIYNPTTDSTVPRIAVRLYQTNAAGPLTFDETGVAEQVAIPRVNLAMGGATSIDPSSKFELEVCTRGPATVGTAFKYGDLLYFPLMCVNDGTRTFNHYLLTPLPSYSPSTSDPISSSDIDDDYSFPDIEIERRRLLKVNFKTQGGFSDGSMIYVWHKIKASALKHAGDPVDFFLPLF